MEPWALAVLCSMLVLAGAIVGGLAVFVIGLRLHRRRCPKLHARAVAAEDLEAQAGDPEKCAPRVAVCRPPAPAPLEIVCQPSAPAPQLNPAPHTLAVSPVDSPTAPAARSASPRPPATPLPPPAAAEAPSISGCRALTGLGVLTPAASFPDRSASADWSAGCKAQSTCSSATTAATKTPQKPAAAAAVRPSPRLPPTPAGGSARRTARRPAAIATTAAPLCEGSPRVPAAVAAVYASSRLGCHPSPKSSPESIDESNLDTISSNESPATPGMLGSPCDSVDYVVVPPSPSIASLYITSIPGSPAGPPSVLSPRSAHLGRSLASPARAAGKSLFSPPPATYNRRYFGAEPPGASRHHL